MSRIKPDNQTWGQFIAETVKLVISAREARNGALEKTPFEHSEYRDAAQDEKELLEDLATAIDQMNVEARGFKVVAPPKNPERRKLMEGDDITASGGFRSVHHQHKIGEVRVGEEVWKNIEGVINSEVRNAVREDRYRIEQRITTELVFDSLRSADLAISIIRDTEFNERREEVLPESQLNAHPPRGIGSRRERCPQCGTPQPLCEDGSPFIHCKKCGYCKHVSITGTICDTCLKDLA